MEFDRLHLELGKTTMTYVIESLMNGYDLKELVGEMFPSDSGVTSQRIFELVREIVGNPAENAEPLKEYLGGEWE